jgi:2-polyprenyl-6-methoxyphenol hydroxylase-like FAD-dependent oxidoreductase
MPALTIGQSVFEELLLKELRASDVEIRAPFVATSFEHEPHGVRAHVERREPLGSPAHRAEWETVEVAAIDAAFVIGADGYNSGVRDALGIDNLSVGPSETFAMFEGPETSSQQVGPGSALELSFGGKLGNLLLPLPRQRSRWGFQLASELNMNPDLEQLRALCRRTPWHSARPERVEWSTVTHFERRLARCFGSGRVWLAGDAAHITSPFGGQSMNGGLTEVHDLVERMADCLLAGKPVTDLEQLSLAREREWAKVLGYNVELKSPITAPDWLREHARRIIPALPLSGLDLQHQLRELGVTIH